MSGDNVGMPPRASKTPPTGYPEFAVRREVISRFFDPPMPRSTFHDLVSKGIVLPVKGLRGFYKLNESLSRLGLREVPSLPEDVSKLSGEDIVRLAFAGIDRGVFPDPSWMLRVEALDVKDIDHASLLADKHREHVEALDCAEEKLAYFSGVLDAQVKMEE